MPAVTAYIGLGTNLGHRGENIRGAVEKLRATPGVEVTRVSAFMENPAVGGPAGSPPFLNAAAELHTAIGPHALLRRLLEIERELGRVRRDKWDPRLIDLDVLLYGDEVLNDADLSVPHPLMQHRDFVLVPLAELAADVVHPHLQVTIGKLLQKLDRKANAV